MEIFTRVLCIAGNKLQKVEEVIVTRHVERPRRVMANHHHHHHHHPRHHHHHHVHPTVKREVTHYRHGTEGKRFINRRAELLQYSQDLRRSARPPAPTPPLPLPNPSNNRTPETKVIHIRRNSKDGRNPACLGNCKTTIPNFFKLLRLRTGNERNKTTKSFATGNKITALKKAYRYKSSVGFSPNCSQHQERTEVPVIRPASD